MVSATEARDVFSYHEDTKARSGVPYELPTKKKNEMGKVLIIV